MVILEVASVADFLRHLSQRLQLPVIDQAKLSDKIVEVFVAGVNVRLGSHADNGIEVMDVDVDKDAEKSGQDFRTHLLEILRERDPCSGWKYVFIVDQCFDPLHQCAHVQRS